MAQVVWTQSALDDLQEIADYISKDSVRFAEITVDKLFSAVDILESFPLSGAMVPEFQNDRLRQLVRGRYRIVYRIVNDHQIDILTVHHCARYLHEFESD